LPKWNQFNIAKLNKISFNVVSSGVTRNETALTDKLRGFTEFKIVLSLRSLNKDGFHPVKLYPKMARARYRNDCCQN